MSSPLSAESCAASPFPAPPLVNVAELAREVRDLRTAIRIMLSVVHSGVSLFSFAALLNIPRFEKIFEDMLGDRNMLPSLTRWVIEWGRLAPLSWLILLGAIISGYLVLFLTRGIGRACLLYLGLEIPLLIHAMICWLATFLPLLTIIKGLSGGM